MMKIFNQAANFIVYCIILITPFVILNNIKKLEAKIEQPKIIVYKVDNAGTNVVGKVTQKQIIEGRYTITIYGYGKFLVTAEQYKDIKIGEEAPEYLKKRGS